MKQDLIAKATIDIAAPVYRVWEALVDPKAIKQYMFGTTVVSDWQEGKPILWKGEWQGKAYEDKGMILQMLPEKVLQYSHFSPLTGDADVPENYHTVTIILEEMKNHTTVLLSQNKNASEEERQHSQENWKAMLLALKEYVEKSSR